MRLVFLIILMFSLQSFAVVIKVGKNQSVKSFTEAVNRSSEGDTIMLMAGTHVVVSTDGINFPRLKSGTTLAGAERDKVILKPKEDNPTHEALLKIIDRENIVIKNLTLDTPQGSIFIQNSENITVENCTFIGFRWNAKRRLALEVKNGSTFGGSSNLLFKHLLFSSSNPVHLGTGNSGTFSDICLYKIENSNYWFLSNSSKWKYEKVIAHKTVLKKAHQNVALIHNFAEKQPWLEKRDGLRWGAVKRFWMPLKPRFEPKKASNPSDSLFDSLENNASTEEAIDINIEVQPVRKKDLAGPEYFPEIRQKYRDIKEGTPLNRLRGMVSDPSGIASMTVYEKSFNTRNGRLEILHTHNVKLSDKNSFDQELELDEENNLIVIEIKDKLGNTSLFEELIKDELPSSKKNDSPVIHLFKMRDTKRIVSLTEKEKTDKPFFIIKGYVDFHESVDRIYAKSGTKTILASRDSLGNFSVVVPLQAGDNEIEVIVIDKAGDKETESYDIESEQSADATDIEKPVIQLERTRGAQEIITGRILDKSSIPLFLINGREVKLDPKGRFNYKLDLTPSENIITLSAYDTSGNHSEEKTKRSGMKIYESLTEKGEYHALVIGINSYTHQPELKTPVNDATEIAEVLEKQYGFNVTLLTNPTRKFIISKLEKLRNTLKPDHKLLIYYAGHGYYDEKVDLAYWLPADAETEDSNLWISSDDIKTNLRGTDANNILLVSDSCFSGAISGKRYRSVSTGKESPVSETLKRPCRLLLSSGGNEPVADGNKKHSVFASAFLWSLKDPPAEIFSVTDIYPDIYETVRAGAGSQKPDLEFIQNSGHISGGTFVFKRVKK